MVDGDHDLGSCGGWGGSAGCGRAAADLDQGCGAAPVGRAQVPPGPCFAVGGVAVAVSGASGGVGSVGVGGRPGICCGRVGGARVGGGQRVQGGAKDGAGFGVELSADPWHPVLHGEKAKGGECA